jgi:hypothetical protein
MIRFVRHDASPSPEELHRVAEAHALGAHHPVDHAPAGLTRPEAVPEVLARRHHEARALVVVEGAAADEIGTMPPELDARRLHQRHEVRLALEPLQLRLGDPGH